MENTIQDDFGFELELRNQEWFALNKTPEEAAKMIKGDFLERVVSNLKKYETVNPVLKKRREIMLKVWEKVGKIVGQ